MSNILEHLKIYLLSSCFFVLCLASQPASPFTFEHGCHERQNCQKFLLPVFPEFSPRGGMKNSQEIKNNLGPRILLRAVWCYWQIKKQKPKLSTKKGKMLLPHLRKQLSKYSDLGLVMTYTRTHFKIQLVLSIPPSYLSVHTIL